jgi:pimeloyl-ACP methyl ester carboxylesterase
MDAIRLSPPRRFRLPVSNRWGEGEMAVLDFGDPKRPVDLVFAHANGFNALTYRTLLAPLSGSLRIWVPDLRGHGGTALPTETRGRRGWSDHATDLTGVLDALDGPPVVLAGHSMGGAASLLAAAERPERVSKLVLFDPVIFPPLAAILFRLPLLSGLPGRHAWVPAARRRRDRFASREEALASYRGRGAFKGWPETMLADYLIDGLVEDGDGFRLAASPDWEASNYGSQGHDVWGALRRLRGPALILKAETGSTCYLTQAPRGRADVRIETVAGGTHFFPMLKPDVARDALFEAAV